MAGVPYEIVTPPVPITELAPLDELRRLLFQNEAEGTRVLPWYAFGMHINPEIPSDDPGELRDFLRAFLLLYPSLKRRVKVDLARSISPYINPFPDAYARLILQPDYPADAGRLIDDYLAHNPTRNRPLDMLPVLCHLDRAARDGPRAGEAPRQSPPGVPLPPAELPRGRAGLDAGARVEQVGGSRAAGRGHG